MLVSTLGYQRSTWGGNPSNPYDTSRAASLGSSSGSAASADAPGSSSPGPTTDDSSNPVTEGTLTSSVGTGETDTSQPTTGEGTEDTGSEDLPAPKIGPYGAPVRLLINDPDDEDDDPTLTADQLELYFASYREQSSGQDDLFVARRETTDHEWDVPLPVTAWSIFPPAA